MNTTTMSDDALIKLVDKIELLAGSNGSLLEQVLFLQARVEEITAERTLDSEKDYAGQGHLPNWRPIPNPALENVLAKLRNFIPFMEGEDDTQGIKMECCGVLVGVVSVGDLRRWVESENPDVAIPEPRCNKCGYPAKMARNIPPYGSHNPKLGDKCLNCDNGVFEIIKEANP